jgi:hypothetical protein
MECTSFCNAIANAVVVRGKMFRISFERNVNFRDNGFHYTVVNIALNISGGEGVGEELPNEALPHASRYIPSHREPVIF